MRPDAAVTVDAAADARLPGLDRGVIPCADAKFAETGGVQLQAVEQIFFQLRQMEDNLLIGQAIGSLGVITDGVAIGQVQGLAPRFADCRRNVFKSDLGQDFRIVHLHLPFLQQTRAFDDPGLVFLLQ